MLKFERIEILYGLILIPVFILVFLLFRYRSLKDLDKFAKAEIRGVIMPWASSFKAIVRFAFLLTGIAFLLTALAGPRVGSSLKEVKKKGREIIIALDVSNSMLAEDVKPNRLESAKRSLNRLLNELEDDRIGMIVFAGDAYTQIPVTNDYGAARLFLNSVSTDMVSRQGTALGAAIDLASRSFSPSGGENSQGKEKARAIIIITDGENHEDDAIEAAKNAAEKGISIHTIGLGDPDGVPLPVSPGSRQFRKDKDGNVVVSRLDITVLKQIASIGNGFFVREGESASGLQQLMQKLDELDEGEYTARVFADYRERYQYFAAIGLFFLVLEALILARKNTWFDRIKLFS